MLKKVTHIGYDWPYFGYDLLVTTDTAPGPFTYEKKEVNNKILYFGQDEQGFCALLVHQPSYEEGFYGGSFTLKMRDGTQETITGPWVSNSGDFNEHFPDTVGVRVRVGDAVGSAVVLVDRIQGLVRECFRTSELVFVKGEHRRYKVVKATRELVVERGHTELGQDVVKR